MLREAESEAFEKALGEWSAQGELRTSALSGVEVSRALRVRLDDGLDPRGLADALEQALADLPQHPVDSEVLALARVIGPARLRSLDAVHVATATLLQVDLLVGYDDRMLATAEELGIRTSSPGRD